MALIYNGTTLPSTANITYNGTSLTKIIYNGVTVWQKSFYVIQNGNVADSGQIASVAVLGGYSGHAGVNSSTHTVKTFTNSVYYPASNIYGTEIQGIYNGGDHTDCTNTSWIKFTITFGSGVAGKSVTADFLGHYSARYFGAKFIVRNGGESGADIINLSGNPPVSGNTTVQKTFTLNSNGVLYFYGEFPCENDSWCPSMRIGLINLKVN